MRRHGAAAVVLAGVVGALSFAEDAIGAEGAAFAPSKQGSFQLRPVGMDCELWFVRSGVGTKLFSAETCADPSVTGFNETRRIGAYSLPAQTGAGDEFHLFEIPMARGGNWSARCEYYGVVVGPRGAWASEVFNERDCGWQKFQSVGMTVVNSTAHLSFTILANTFDAGAIYDLSFGRLQVTPIPQVARPAPVVSRVVHHGELGGPHGYSNGKLVVNEGRESTIIDEPGSCGFDGLNGKLVEMTGQLQKWPDGYSVLTCLSIAVDHTPGASALADGKLATMGGAQYAAVALRHFENACVAGNPEGCRLAGERQLNLQRAIPLIRRGCALGDEPACANNLRCGPASAGATRSSIPFSPDSLARCRGYCSQGLPGACVSAAEQLSATNRSAEAKQLLVSACQLGMRRVCAAAR